MLDVFDEQSEVLIKDGIANLYWYRGDLRKAWLRVGVSEQLTRNIWSLQDHEGRPISKRSCMDRLYEHLRSAEFASRVKVSREFVRILVEHRNFVPQDPKHRIEIAERAALKLKELIAAQNEERDKQLRARTKAASERTPSYEERLVPVRRSFDEALGLTPQQKGYALERIFTSLMRASDIQVEAPFALKGEQVDGAIKHEGSHYIVEVKWQSAKADPQDIGAFYFKVDGRMGARGIFIAMHGYTDGVLETLPRGKELKVILLDGNHLANVIYGQYRFQELLNHAIKCASLRGQLYCSHRLE